ncbi:hypothetical protein [Aquimarina spinulae]|uniref:hypothetical protein n=1 Tax=Aquimarina spinulae TaxID=1192023 RepID=UPI000D55BF65|nr:hypothetical protein [Aquimarina spinulae]
MKYIKILFLALLLPLTLQGQEVFEVKFTAGLTQYRCALVIFDNGTGKMRVRYYDKRTTMIEQTMAIENTQYGIRLKGYNPVYAGTKIKHPSYNADNFYISMDEYGKYTIINVDDAGTRAKSYIKKIKGKYTINNFLRDFNWKL